MTEPARRKWLQVHLSTAVVLMFAAGGIIWGNVTRVPFDRFISFRQPDGWPEVDAERIETIEYNYGWPFSVAKHDAYGDHRIVRYVRWWLALDALVALAILFTVWFVCERWIAWRSRRRNSSKDSALN